MKKETMYILGGVALVGLAYYIYNQNKPSTTPSTSSFANLSGKGSGCSCGTCPAGFTCQSYQTLGGTKLCACISEIK